jgi:hypothetical protein
MISWPFVSSFPCKNVIYVTFCREAEIKSTSGRLLCLLSGAENATKSMDYYFSRGNDISYNCFFSYDIIIVTNCQVV